MIDSVVEIFIGIDSVFALTKILPQDNVHAQVLQ
jgi:hypothetical protein